LAETEFCRIGPWWPQETATKADMAASIQIIVDPVIAELSEVGNKKNRSVKLKTGS
jgi:hypothetical protein